MTQDRSEAAKRIIKELLFREDRKIKTLGGIDTADLRALVDESALHIDALVRELKAVPGEKLLKDGDLKWAARKLTAFANPHEEKTLSRVLAALSGVRSDAD